MINNLKKIREVKGITQQELSEVTGISVENISRYENDHCLPEVSTAIELSEALEVAVNDIYILEEKDYE